jgi:very-short-patch-repair endonuclease
MSHTSRKSGCPSCNESKGEKLIASLLDKNRVKYVREYKIPNSTTRYEYDFYLPDRGLLIEFHGIQHYKPIEFFGGEEAFKQSQFNDKYKKWLAKEFGYKLISINYKQHKFLSRTQFEKHLLRLINL